MPSEGQWVPGWTEAQQNEALALSEKMAEEFVPIQIACASLNCVFSFAVLLTGFLLYEKLVKGKVYVKMIMMISLCDFLAAFVMTFGYPKDNSLCEVQAFTSVLFFRASWFWTILSIITVFLQIQSESGDLLKFRHAFVFILVMSCILQVIPSIYGEPYGACFNGISYGHIQWNGPQRVMVHLVSEYAWLSVCVFISLILPIVLMFHTLPKKFRGANDDIQKIMKRLTTHIIMYPIALFIFWGPTSIYGTYYGIIHSGPNGSYDNTQTPQEFIDTNKIFLTLGSWSYLFGACTSLIFFSKSPKARFLLRKIISEALCSHTEKDVKNQTRLQDAPPP